VDKGERSIFRDFVESFIEPPYFAIHFLTGEQVENTKITWESPFTSPKWKNLATLVW